MKLHRPGANMLIVILFSLFHLIALGQSKNTALTSPAFITDNNINNTIVIPNQEKFYQFKVYRKDTIGKDFTEITTLVIPEKTYLYSRHLPYEIEWTDETSHNTNAEYRITAFNRAGTKICELKVIRQARKQYLSCL